MNLADVLKTAQSWAAAAKAAIAAGQDVVPMVKAFAETFDGKPVTDEKLKALQDAVDASHNDLQAIDTSETGEQSPTARD